MADETTDWQSELSVRAVMWTIRAAVLVWLALVLRVFSGVPIGLVPAVAMAGSVLFMASISVRAVMWTVHAAALAWFALALWAFSNVVVDFGPYLYVALSALILLAVWLVFVVSIGVLLLRRKLRASGIRWESWFGLIWIPLVGLTFWIIVGLDLSFRARLRLSEAALETFAEERLADGGRWRGARRVGLFRVMEGDVVDGCVRMITTHDFVDDAGLVRCGGEPMVVGEDSYVHIRGWWWRWYRSW